MQFTDTHIHLDSDAFDADRADVIAASREAGIGRWINVGYNEARWSSTAALVQQHDGMACMLGLHPGDADAWSPELMDRLAERVRSVGAVAIGEIGIDLYWRQDNLERQREAFQSQLALARELGLPAVIHMRDADTELLDVLEAQDALPHVHFHSFDGKDALRSWVLAHGATIGVGGLITRRGSEDLQQWVAGLPHDRVMLESDSPYLKPRGIRGKRNEPAYLVKIAKLLASLWDASLDDVSEVTERNASRIFGLKERRE